MPGEAPPLTTVAQIRAARARLAAVLRPTPLVRSDSLSALAGRTVLLKPEHLQRTGSFKIRGAYNHIAGLSPRPDRVVAGSAGNHAQGVALAASLAGVPSTVFMPVSVPLPKADATRAYGAEVRLEDGTVEDAVDAACRFADDTGAALVPPFDDPAVVAGQGSVGLEIAEEAPAGTTAVVPVGGGGLISGVAAALAAERPDIGVIGVQASAAAAMVASLSAGRVVTIDRPLTIADGIAIAKPCALTLAHVQGMVDEIVTVTDEEISRAIILLLERAKAVVEPAGAAGLAAVLAGKVGGEGPVAVVLSGGNVDLQLLIKLIEHGLSSAGRYLRLRVVLTDRPGSLAAVTDAVAALGLNVLEVEHHRAGITIGVDEVEVLLTVGTRDPDHRGEVVEELTAAGFRVELLD